MAPLDAAGGSEFIRSGGVSPLAAGGRDPETAQAVVSEAHYAREGMATSMEPGFGESLHQVRTARGLSLEQLAELTRVRRVYLEALESEAFDQLPSRPFAIGYVKAYARALGLDEEVYADRFKLAAPVTQEALGAPLGSSFAEVKPRRPVLLIAGLALLASVVVWNIAQRALLLEDKKPVQLVDGPKAWVQGVPLIQDGLMAISPPRPAPKDQAVPEPYVTPGLEEGFAAVAAAQAAQQASGQEQAVADDAPLQRAFNPRGPVYGSAPGQSIVTLQAKKPVNLVVRSSDGTIYFARLLAEGEAYRAPQSPIRPLTVDVSDPAAMEVFIEGEFAGALGQAVIPLSRLNARSGIATVTSVPRPARTASRAAPEAPKPVPLTTPEAPLPYNPAQASPAPAQPADGDPLPF
ncbi:MAG: helix-turn-helix domain-containing protein [Asticcacaulis sp.]